MRKHPAIAINFVSHLCRNGMQGPREAPDRGVNRGPQIPTGSGMLRMVELPKLGHRERQPHKTGTLGSSLPQRHKTAPSMLLLTVPVFFDRLNGCFSLHRCVRQDLLNFSAMKRVKAATLCRSDQAPSPRGYWRSADHRAIQADWSTR